MDPSGTTGAVSRRSPMHSGGTERARHMPDETTSNTAAAYLSLKQTFADLNRLAVDFGAALRDEGHDFSSSEEYSYGTNSLALKRSHAWLFHAPRDQNLRRTE